MSSNGARLAASWARMGIWDIGGGRTRSNATMLRACGSSRRRASLELTVLTRTVSRGFTNSGWPNWLLPVLYTAGRQLRAFAILADEEDKKEGKDANKLEDAARTLNKMFTLCLSDRFDPRPPTQGIVPAKSL